MSGGSAQHGRRDNGLYAAEYVVVGDVDPRIGEHLLDVLGNRGIAAYLQPSSDQHPITRLTTLPSRPTDRLFVDRSELALAKEFLAIVSAGIDDTGRSGVDRTDAVGAEDTDAGDTDAKGTGTGAPAVSPPGASPTAEWSPAPDGTSGSTPLPAAGPPAARESDEFEAAWASIIARFDSSIGTGIAPWPSSEDVAALGGTPADRTGAVIPTDRPRRPDSLRHDPPRSEPPRSESSRSEPPVAGAATPRGRGAGSGPSGADIDGSSLLDGLDGFGTTLPDEEEEDYQPPPPPPLPRLAWVTIMGILGVIAGVAIIANPDLLPTAPTSAAILGGACLLAGAVALIGRLRSGDEDEPDDPDDGAVV